MPCFIFSSSKCAHVVCWCLPISNAHTCQFSFFLTFTCAHKPYVYLPSSKCACMCTFDMCCMLMSPLFKRAHMPVLIFFYACMCTFDVSPLHIFLELFVEPQLRSFYVGKKTVVILYLLKHLDILWDRTLTSDLKIIYFYVCVTNLMGKWGRQLSLRCCR